MKEEISHDAIIKYIYNQLASDKWILEIRNFFSVSLICIFFPLFKNKVEIDFKNFDVDSIGDSLRFYHRRLSLKWHKI